jgi:gas vesicle protein
MRDESGSTLGTVIFSFFLGGLVGAGVALLLAPKSGPETRQKIKEIADDVKGKAEGYYETAKGKAEGYYETARERASGTLEKGKEFVEKKKGLVTSAVEAGVEAYEREKGKLSEGN